MPIPLVGVIISQAWYFGLSFLVTVHTHQLITLGVKSKLEIVDFGFEILGLKFWVSNPEIFSGLKPSKNLLQSLGLNSSQHFAIADW